MKKKNKVIDNKQKKKLIITSIFMLFLVIAASFAYYEMNSTESITSVFTSNFGETGGVSLTGPTPNLHIKLTNKDMHYTKEGTSYYATDDNNKNYDETPVERTIAKIEAVDTNPTYTYYCRFKLAIDVRDSKNNKFKTGDAILHLSGHYEADLDLSNYETPIDIEYFLDQDNTSKEIKAVLEVKNTTNNQSYAEGMNIELDIYNSNLVCDHEKVELINTEWTYAYTGNYQEFNPPISGYYKIELWGAQGGNNTGGKGGYVSGNVYFSQNSPLYIYVGNRLNGTWGYCYTTQPNAAYNGNTLGACAGGGGATDIRLMNGNWDNIDSLKSRIMVAGAGGGSYYGKSAGAGGGLIGGQPTSLTAGSGQTHGGNENPGTFGISGRSTTTGGGGYYGGAGGASANHDSGGGSSFISGHNGCVAIESASSLTPRLDSNGNICTDGTTDIECSKHYSGYVFTDTVMIDGEGYSWTTEKGEQVKMPNPSGGYYDLGQGHTGNGFVKITYLGFDYGTDIVIALDEGEGTLTGDKKLRRKIGSVIGELPTPTHETEAFKGWYTKDGELVDENTIVEEKYQKLYARFGNEFAYTGNEQVFIALKSGTYKIELWGAQGGTATGYYEPSYIGGYGGYSTANINLNKNDKLYVIVGGQGDDIAEQCVRTTNGSGYNGGGQSSCQGASAYGTTYSNYLFGGGGGGATHVAKVSGLLNTLESYKGTLSSDNKYYISDNIIMVAGGGGGATSASSRYGSTGGHVGNGGSGGGFTGVSGAQAPVSTSYWGGGGGTQTAAGTSNGSGLNASTFGFGCNAYDEISGGLKVSGGGGFFGGGCGQHSGAGGGSGYIGNQSLIDKHMTCYNCTASNEENTKTISTTCYDENAKTDCSKKGNGYARITFIK